VIRYAGLSANQLPESEFVVRFFFGFFFVSGFCSILYELIWLRLAMAQFAVTTALVSIVLSTFMIGLGLGSWGAGRYVRSLGTTPRLPSLRLYALVELLIGVSAFAVSRELTQGRALLEQLDASHALSLPTYYILAGLWIGLTLIPWCACMGATFPFAMAAIQERFPAESERSFSYLYLANVLGALTGAAVPLLLIEEWGFRGTLSVGAVLNLCLAVSAFLVSLQPAQTATPVIRVPERAPAQKAANPLPYYVLFGTGFTSMAVEVVWIRLFTPALGTVVYAFATILGLYLGATYLGSQFYRSRKSNRGLQGARFLFAMLALSVVFPLLMCDPRLPAVYPLRVAAILPFSFIVGWITPMVLDDVARGDPGRAGRGYAINIAGCVLGPLASGFLLLPYLGERYTLFACALPWAVLSLHRWLPATTLASTVQRPEWKPAFALLLSLVLVVVTRDFETRYSPREVRRDSTATVTAIGSRMGKKILVNGISMTSLSPVTKMIAHLPMAFLQRPPQNVLVICFGMGTTHRSMLSWGISSTAVELVPSVVSLFPFFHADAEKLLRSPLSRIVINDGRFYLERSSAQYDVIVIDPPPPVEAAASSLLYSTEFYAIARRRLRSGGILQQWIPMTSSDPVTLASVAEALRESFPYVRVFRSIEGWGFHFLASDSPLPDYSASTLASHLPPAATADLLEWGPATNAEDQFARVLKQELSLSDLMERAPDVPALQDDRPVNEYFLLRWLRNRENRQKVWRHFLHGAEQRS
jgi:spermidine synthase